MVHDPRVTSALARLGGVYRDPSRVDRDAASLLKSSVGVNLMPISAEMVENNGTTSTVLVLQGTIAIHFRSNTYQLLTDMYLPAGYPQRPPVAYVRLANSNMYLKENHRHVGPDGKIYLPYLHEWKPPTHNLIELVVAMSSVFSADPPVFTRTSNNNNPSGASIASGGGTSPSSGTYHHGSSATEPLSPPPLPPHSSAAFLASPTVSAQMESMVAREAAEANAAAAAARRAQEEEDRKLRMAQEEERRRQESLLAQKQWEQSTCDTRKNRFA
jgi:ESCRT-I complex subunit TSG101